MLTEHNNYMTEDAIRAMPHEDLVEAVIRMLKVKEVDAQQWFGPVLLEDHLADAFRGRLS